MSTLRAQERFDAASLAGLDEPVRRYPSHALRDGAQLHRRVELRYKPFFEAAIVDARPRPAR